MASHEPFPTSDLVKKSDLGRQIKKCKCGAVSMATGAGELFFSPQKTHLKSKPRKEVDSDTKQEKKLHFTKAPKRGSNSEEQQESPLNQNHPAVCPRRRTLITAAVPPSSV